MTTAKIVKISKDSIVKTGERFLNVIVEITEGKGKSAVSHEVVWGYPLTTSKKEIEKDIKKYLKNRKEEKERAEENAQIEAEDKQADKTIEVLSGLEVTEK